MPELESRRHQERLILLFTCIAHALTHVYMLIYPAVLEPMRLSFGLEQDEFLAYATISTVLFGAGALPAGWLGDRCGEKGMLVAFFVLTALGGTLLGLARGTIGLAVGMFAVGAGTSIFHPVGNAMISKGIREPGKAMGMNGLWGSLGTAAAPAFAGQVAYFLDWRWAYLLLTAPMLVLAWWLARTRFETLATDPPPSSPPPERRDEASAVAPPPVEGLSGSNARRGRGGAVAWVPMVGLLLLAMTCGGFYFHLITTMLPTHFEDAVSLGASGESASSASSAAGGSLLGAAWITGAVYAIGGIGQLLAGHLVHRREGRGVYIVVLLVATPLVFLLSRLRDVPLVAVASLMSIGIFAVQPVENVLLSRYSPSRVRGSLFGAKFVLAFGVGGLGTALSGVLAQRYGVPSVFTVASGFTALAALLAFAAWLIRVRTVPETAETDAETGADSDSPRR